LVVSAACSQAAFFMGLPLPVFLLYSYKRMIFLVLEIQEDATLSGTRTQAYGRPEKRSAESAAHASEMPVASATESPLLWMARRKDKSGETMIGPAAFAAGERLRADLTFSGMLPRVTMDWSGRMPGGKGGDGASLNPTEAALAARQRVDKALRDVGPEFSGLLVDLCGFAKGLELIEM
jgi:hypothetical protein